MVEVRLGSLQKVFMRRALARGNSNPHTILSNTSVHQHATLTALSRNKISATTSYTGRTAASFFQRNFSPPARATKWPPPPHIACPKWRNLKSRNQSSSLVDEEERPYLRESSMTRDLLASEASAQPRTAKIPHMAAPLRAIETRKRRGRSCRWNSPPRIERLPTTPSSAVVAAARVPRDST